MKKKEYEKPTMMVVKLQHMGMLMTSGQLNDPEDYILEDDPFSFAPQLPGGPNLFDF